MTLHKIFAPQRHFKSRKTFSLFLLSEKHEPLEFLQLTFIEHQGSIIPALIEGDKQ